MRPHPSTSPQIVGLLLAAGRSRRMGRLKQTMPWPGDDGLLNSTVIASAFDAISPFCRRMFVIAGADAQAVSKALGDRSCATVEGDSDAEMLESVRIGLSCIIAMRCGSKGVLMHPGDHPGVARTTIKTILNAGHADPARAIMPEHNGKGGHPVLIPLAIAQSIVSWAESGSAAGGGRGGGGLRQFWIDHADVCCRLPVDDPSCTLDLDTPEDYERALARLTAS